MLFDTVAIWGMGLIGGSIGMALRQRNLARHIVGVGRDEGRLKQALDAGACEEIATDFDKGFSRADLVILCTPVAILADALPRIAPHIREGAVITDAGSTKARIVTDAVAAFGHERHFVGSHPMSGGEMSGVAHARPDLFVGNPCFVTPHDGAAPQGVLWVKRLWTGLGSRVIMCAPQSHDDVVAALSHAPHIASSALALLGARPGSATDFLASAAGNGYWDTTRLAKGSPEVWSEICTENRENIVAALRELITNLEEARRLIEKGGDIGGWLRRAADARLLMDSHKLNDARQTGGA